MPAIDKIKLKNFKFFNGEETLNLDGKSLLLYGENGSGKSSLYWALYTFFQSASKSEGDIKKYFDKADSENLINKYAGEEDASIALEFEDETSNEVSYLKMETHDGTLIKEMASTSEFINYRLLSKIYDFYNSEDIDLFPFIEKEMLEFMTLRSSLGDYSNTPNSKKGDDWWAYLKHGLGENNHPRHDSRKVINFTTRLNTFCNDLEFYLVSLIEETNKLLKINFSFDVKLYFEIKHASYNDFIDKRHIRSRKVTFPRVVIKAQLVNSLDKNILIEIEKPHVHLNEAKLSAIALCLRLAQLKERQLQDTSKLLVLDDLLLSLDMSNRDIVLNIIINQLNEYQIIFLTHDRNFFDFIKHKINQQGSTSKWNINEMYPHISEVDNIEKPLIIESDFSEEEKAIRYFKLKDYTTCSLYLRKSFEKTLKNKLPPELIKSHDGGFISLNSLWQKFVARAQVLATPVPQGIRDSFDQSKLLILNPQAHYSELSQPIYRIELEQAFQLLTDIKALVLPNKRLLLSKGHIIHFKHPTQNYWIKYELSSDLEAVNKNLTLFPKCKISAWQFDGEDYHVPGTGKVFTQEEVKAFSENRLDRVIEMLMKDAVLAIDKEMFLSNTFIENTSVAFSEVLNGISIEEGVFANIK